MKKNKVIVLVIIMVIITSVVTFTVSNLIQIKLNDKIFVRADKYEYLQELEYRFDKLLYLEEYIDDNYYKDTEEVDFDDFVIKGLFEALEDPYSTYMTTEEYQKFVEINTGTYSGIGVIVTESEDGYIEVVSPIDGTPGQAAGLKPGDRIIKVDGIDVTTRKIDYVVTLIKGEEGTSVTLTIDSDDDGIFDVDITRARIVTKSVTSEVLEDSVGYIRINIFDDKSYNEFKENINGLLESNVESLIIDVRSNPGGSLNEVIKIADLLLGEQIIVYTEDREGNREIERSDKNKINVPIAVLTNGGSASASEILTAAVQDTNSGVVIGDTTFGKGLVQLSVPLKDGSAFKLTVSEYYTPNGVNIHGVGIKPNYDVEYIESKGYIVDEENDGVLEFATDYIKTVD
ncbi:MAG: S41 family peptidase [Bacillota bacterium]|nr:S41 family peptidase [Bacillota bacterium]